MAAPETDVLALYRAHSLGTRLFVRARQRLFPFAHVLAYVPRGGKLLDVGCGHGLFSLLVAQQRPDTQVLGVDPDARKIRALERAAAAFPNVRFLCGRVEDVTASDFDCAALLDVLIYVPQEKQLAFVDAVRARLASGGTLLLAMNDKRPRWKYAVTRLQETCMRLSGLTQAEALHFVAPDDMARQLAQRGFSVTVVELPVRGLYPHRLLVARKT
jgi:2-polyprenyl-6-hydroxyphenyl methylase/3-demethylubiquinone-9 3-methyltransferase